MISYEQITDAFDAAEENGFDLHSMSAEEIALDLVMFNSEFEDESLRSIILAVDNHLLTIGRQHEK
jgi:hypothetical protein